MPASLILRFARESRRFIVSSGTRKARAISSVRQAAERAQRQRDLRLEPERRMAAGEDQLQPLVGKRPSSSISSSTASGTSSRRVFAASVRSRRRRSIARLRAVIDQPGAGIGRRAVARPALGGDREGLLSGFLGEVEVAEEADQAGEDAAPLVAEDLLEQRYLSTSGRTSIAPPIRAAGMRAAISSAASRSSASTTQVAAEVLLRLDERAVGEQRLSVLNAHGRGRLDRLQLLAADDAGRLPDGEVLAQNRPAPPRRGR